MSSPSGHMTTLSEQKIQQFSFRKMGVGSLAACGHATAMPERDLANDMAVLGKNAVMNTQVNQQLLFVEVIYSFM